MVTTQAQSRRMEAASQYEEPLVLQDEMDDRLEVVGRETDADLFGKSHERVLIVLHFWPYDWPN